MKKLTLLLHEPDVGFISAHLKRWGVVHVQIAEQEKRAEQVQLINLKSQYQSLIEKLSSHYSVKNQEVNTSESVEALFTKAGDLFDKETELTKQLDLLNKQLQVTEFWGFTNKELVDRLKEDDIQFRCFSAHKSRFDQHDFGDNTIQVILQDQSRVYFILVEKSSHQELQFEEVHMPESDANELKSEIAILQESLNSCQVAIQEIGNYYSLFETQLLKITNQLADVQVQAGFDPMAGGNFSAMVGWIPSDQEDIIRNHLINLPIAWSITAPEKSDHVPVQLVNNPINKLFEPITRIFQLPNYFELDLTPFIAVFYPIFFAYCLGDAGYGLVLFGLSLVALFTFLKKRPGFARLGMVLGAVTTLMGIVKSGSVFGIATMDPSVWPFISYLGRFVVVPDDQSFAFNAFNVAIVIGIIQILTAILLAIYKNLRFKGLVFALAPVGKLMIIIASLTWFLQDVQDVGGLTFLAGFTGWILFVGVLLFVVFYEPDLPIATRLSSGLLPLFFVFSNMLGDILSYVRLFALGVASAILGLVVNQIGMQIWDADWWGWMPGIIFLVFGHGLNMGLAILGAFVHPLRLTFVEFYNNAGFEGGGIPYRPFRFIEKEEIITNK